MRLPPATVLETWPTPNYVNPVTRGNALVYTNAIFITLMTVAVGLRVYARISTKRFWWDDAAIIGAVVSDQEQATPSFEDAFQAHTNSSFLHWPLAS